MSTREINPISARPTNVNNHSDMISYAKNDVHTHMFKSIHENYIFRCKDYISFTVFSPHSMITNNNLKYGPHLLVLIVFPWQNGNLTFTAVIAIFFAAIFCSLKPRYTIISWQTKYTLYRGKR